MSKSKDWTDQQIYYYYLGIKYSDYPAIFWERMKPYLPGCLTLTDIGCGPGAFTLKAAEEGFKVQAVDLNTKSLGALKKQIKVLGLKKIKIICGDWLVMEAEKSDLSVCAYSFGGSIGTLEGINKIIETTNVAAFFITPYKKERTDFLSKELYYRLGISPPSFSGDYRGLLQILKKLGKKVSCETIEYDFGRPVEETEDLNRITAYLGEKLGLPPVEHVKKHVQRIMTVKQGRRWLPNPRQSTILTWEKECNK